MSVRYQDRFLLLWGAERARNCIEFYPGDFSDRIRWNNDASIFLSDDAAEAYWPALRAPNVPGFHDETRLGPKQARALAAAFRAIDDDLARGITPPGLGVPAEILADPCARLAIRTTARVIAEFCEDAARRHGCMWVLGM